MKKKKELTDEVVAQIEAGDLYALLSICDNEDLDPLVRIILSATTNSLDTDSDFKAHSPNHVKYFTKIGDEFRKFGGNSITNLFRGEGPKYAEIVSDVCEKLSAPRKPNETRLNELRLLASTYLKSQLEEDTEKQVPDHIDDAGAHAGNFSNNKGTMLAGAAFFAVSGPVGLAFAGWKLLDTAYRITVPCVLHIARIRADFFGESVAATISLLPTKERHKCPHCFCSVEAITIEDGSILSLSGDVCICPRCGERIFICRSPKCHNYVKGIGLCGNCARAAVRGAIKGTATAVSVVAKATQRGTEERLEEEIQSNDPTLSKLISAGIVAGTLGNASKVVADGADMIKKVVEKGGDTKNE